MPMHSETAQLPRIRACMPDGYLATLAQRTGCTQKQTISDVVRYESKNSKYWPAVEQLAKETDPAGFAAWQAANAPEVAAS